MCATRACANPSPFSIGEQKPRSARHPSLLVWRPNFSFTFPSISRRRRCVAIPAHHSFVCVRVCVSLWLCLVFAATGGTPLPSPPFPPTTHTHTHTREQRHVETLFSFPLQGEKGKREVSEQHKKRAPTNKAEKKKNKKREDIETATRTRNIIILFFVCRVRSNKGKKGKR